MTLLLALLALPVIYVLTLALLGAYLENLPAMGLSVLVVVALIGFALVIA